MKISFCTAIILLSSVFTATAQHSKFKAWKNVSSMIAQKASAVESHIMDDEYTFIEENEMNGVAFRTFGDADFANYYPGGESESDLFGYAKKGEKVVLLAFTIGQESGTDDWAAKKYKAFESDFMADGFKLKSTTKKEGRETKMFTNGRGRNVKVDLLHYKGVMTTAEIFVFTDEVSPDMLF